MKDASIEKEKIHVDYTAGNIPENAKNFMPDVYKDGDQYICVLADSVKGTGDSIEAALADWEKNYKQKQQ